MSVRAVCLLGNVVSRRCRRRVQRSTVAGLPALVAACRDADTTLPMNGLSVRVSSR